MKKLYSLIVGLSAALASFSQPYNFIQPIDPKDSGLVTSQSRRYWDMKFVPNDSIVVDGVMDHKWTEIPNQVLDRYILGATAKDTASGGYIFKNSTEFRMPDSKSDFSGSFRLAYDSFYIYAFYDIIDNEINDGFTNVGINERLEIVEAPYPDSAPQFLSRTNGLVNYPPFSGIAPDLNMKFCYWHYLGAFKINFFLDFNEKCKITFDERVDANAKIDYVKRAADIKCAWKLKSDGLGYTLEVGLNLKTTLADSANNPYKLPEHGKLKRIAFDMFAFDFDSDRPKVPVKSSWNATDNSVWDNMLYTGLLNIWGWGVDIKTAKEEKIGFYPNPTQNIIMLNELANLIEVISMDGVTVKTASNVNKLNVENLFPGIYVIKIDGKPAGKMLKE